MNAITPHRPVPPKKRPQRSDQEFLAPALEILETPASPVRLWLILIICAFVAAALIWTYVGHVDIIATAQGKIEPTGKVKVLQPLQTGKVAEILAQNGDHVTAGQVIVELDATDAKSQLNDLTQQLAALRGEVLRRRTAVDLVSALKNGAADFSVPMIDWTDDIPEVIRSRERGVLQKDLAQLDAQLASTDSQIAQKNIDAKSIAATIVAQESLDDTLRDRAAMRETLVSKEAGSKADWLDSLELLKTQQVTLTTDMSQQADDLADIEVLQREEAKTRGSFLSDYMQKLADAEKRADGIEQKVQQARSQLSQMTLRSPIDGVVQASSVTTVGQVVTTGQELMRIVPAASAIDVEAYLPNEDVGFVHLGQVAAVKVAAFPFTQYGTVTAKVIRIGRDAIPAADAQQALADPSRPPSANSTAGTADATNSLVFPITVQLDATSISVDGAAIDLTPGMGVTVEVNTGSRRILEYLFSPMVEVTQSAMRER